MNGEFDRSDEVAAYARLARYYDMLYSQGTSAEAELDFMEWAFTELAGRQIRAVHDATCGTGRQLELMVQLHPEWAISCSDLSPEMLEVCRRKLDAGGCGEAKLFACDICELPGSEAYDAVISMFSAVNHLLDHAQMASALAAVKRTLAPGGVFIFDHMNFLGLWDRFQRQLVESGRSEEDGVSWQSVRQHSCEPHKSLWKHTDTAQLVFDDGHAESLHFETVLRMWTTTEMEGLVRSAGFSSHHFFAGYNDRGGEKDPKSPTRAVWVCVK